MSTRIISGAANMPSYAGKLRGKELAGLLAFLSSRARDAGPSAAPPGAP